VSAAHASRSPSPSGTRLAGDVETTVHDLPTHDGARISGVLRRPRGYLGTVVSLMHPRQDVTHHRLVAQMLGYGYAVWTQGSRSPNNDLRLVHEETLLDAAAGQGFLRDLGFESQVTVGHSGGGTLYAFYQQQAWTASSERLTHTPFGQQIDLAGADMPAPHGSVFIAPHPGQGALLQRLIDPSVTDEGDIDSTDPSLDPFAPGNGFAPPPDSSKFDGAFVRRYRKAQGDRVRRIDQVALEHMRAESGRAKVITIYRTDADLRSLDLALDPNDRPLGSLFGPRPDKSNFGLTGFARVTTPEAWLSTWSATTTNAHFLSNAPGVSSPSLLIEFTGDQACFPDDARAMFSALAATDKQHAQFPALHFGQPLSKGQPSGIRLAAQEIAAWLGDRFAAPAAPTASA
jgi:hypothetical protein